jgi:hypothetical protein
MSSVTASLDFFAAAGLASTSTSSTPLSLYVLFSTSVEPDKTLVSLIRHYLDREGLSCHGSSPFVMHSCREWAYSVVLRPSTMMACFPEATTILDTAMEVGHAIMDNCMTGTVLLHLNGLNTSILTNMICSSRLKRCMR